MPSPNVTLRFEPDPTTELPHLVDEHGRLSAHVHAAWEAELKARCNNQSLRAGETIQFQTPAKNLPSRYRVRAEPGPSNRMPTYYLDPLDPSPTAEPFPAWSGRTDLASRNGGAAAPLFLPGPTTVPVAAGPHTGWIDGFLADVDRLIGESVVDRYDLPGLQVLRDDLVEVARQHPHDLLVLLVSGFAVAGKLACAGDPAEARRGRYYETALEALNPALKDVASAPGGLGALVVAVSRVLGLGRRG